MLCPSTSSYVMWVAVTCVLSMCMQCNHTICVTLRLFNVISVAAACTCGLHWVSGIISKRSVRYCCACCVWATNVSFSSFSSQTWLVAVTKVWNERWSLCRFHHYKQLQIKGVTFILEESEQVVEIAKTYMQSRWAYLHVRNFKRFLKEIYQM